MLKSLKTVDHPWALGIGVAGLVYLVLMLVPPGLLLADLKTLLPYSFYKTYFVVLIPMRWSPLIITGSAIGYHLYCGPEQAHERYILYTMAVLYVLVGLVVMGIGAEPIKFTLKYLGGFDRSFLMR